MTIFFGALFVVALVTGLLLVFRYRAFEPIDRLILAVLPLLDALIGMELFVIVKVQPLDLWSDVRLARTFALYHGFKLYPGADTTGLFSAPSTRRSVTCSLRRQSSRPPRPPPSTLHAPLRLHWFCSAHLALLLPGLFVRVTCTQLFLPSPRAVS